uniref:Uncharacterized protein n=1 Tax=Anguilla anguilla TaxID=7936 RepID=A0A0E9R4X7_ANGAN
MLCLSRCSCLQRTGSPIRSFPSWCFVRVYAHLRFKHVRLRMFFSPLPLSL